MSKENLTSKLAKNEADRLRQKVQSYNATKSANDMINGQGNLSATNTNNENKKMKNNQSSGKSVKEKIAKKVGSAAMQAYGVPKEASDKIMDFAQSEKGKKLMNATNPFAMGANALDKLFSRGEEKSADPSSGEAQYESSEVSNKVLKFGLAFFALLSPALIFGVLFISATQVFLNAISLGTADSLSSDQVESKINTKGEDGLNEEKSDKDVAYYDVYIDDNDSVTIKEKKTYSLNLVQVSTNSKYLKRKYNEASLDNIEDFYPSVVDETKN